MTVPAQVLALNSGSSSLKFGLFRVSDAWAEAVISGGAETAGAGKRSFWARDSAGGQLASETDSGLDQEGALQRIGEIVSAHAPDAVGHRIVHGGPRLRRHSLIDASVLRNLESAAAFAPLHVPQALSVLRLARARFPRCPHVACLDTAFHADLPDVARVLPLPAALRPEGIERYGFHGLSCESIVHRLGSGLPERLVIAHLGGGASVTAVQRGRSVDTTMGLTPSGGTIMATRCGDLDPGVLIYLMREKGFDAAKLEELVDHRSGLIGISALSGDMRRLREAAASDAGARLAIRMFCQSVRKHVAAMIAVLEGIDMLVFTGGIGEHDAESRAEICEGLAWAGVGAPRCPVRVLAAEEEAEIARRSFALACSAP
jgi:acetate kinase